MLVVNLPQASKGRAREIASARAGLSGKTYSHAKKIRDKSLILRSRSQLVEASVLLNLLNKSVDGAYKILNHPRCDDILTLIASDEAKNPKQALALLASSKPKKKMALCEGMVVKPEPRSKDLAHQGRVGNVRNETIDVWFRNLKTMEMEKCVYKPDEIPLPPDEEPSAEIRSRLVEIQASGSQSPIFVETLNLLMVRVNFTNQELLMLEFLELCCFASQKKMRMDSEQLFNHDLLKNFQEKAG